MPHPCPQNPIGIFFQRATMLLTRHMVKIFFVGVDTKITATRFTEKTLIIKTYNNRIDLMRDSLVLFMIPPVRTGHAERCTELFFPIICTEKPASF